MRHLNTFIVLMALSLATVGCDRGEGAKPVSEPPTETSTSTSGDPSDGTSAAAAAADEGAEQEAACEFDYECRTYLRCIGGSCDVPPAMTGDVSDDTPVVDFTVDGQKVATFHLELAISDPQKQRGLMYRPRMKDDWGMLFVYRRDGPRSFWMKNTLIPLDMVFIDDTGTVVGIVEGAEPLTLEPRTVEPPARYVLELNAGLAAKNGIVEGAKMSLSKVDESVMPKGQ